jgi:16S rRNA (cytidine1402-2'-O)-methyltransferase
VVATPIGNLGDITFRAVEVLGEADVILAEDTRKAGLLLSRLGIRNKRFLSLFEHNEASRVQSVLQMLEEGKRLALISSAGTPTIADPGYVLVRACRQAGHRIAAVPGPSAPLAGLMVSGLPPIPHTFAGFMPRRDRDKKRLLEPFRDVQTTLIFFERKSRLVETLQVCHHVLGSRQACLARELTKQFEEVVPFVLGDADGIPEALRGELTVIIGPPEDPGQRSDEEAVRRCLRQEGLDGGKPKEIAARVERQVQGWSRKEIYELLVRDE